MDLPHYFESMAQAAAMLHVSIYDIKSAKVAGCPAFFGGGRIRSAELQGWLKETRQENRHDSDEHFTEDDWDDWSHRDLVLLELIEYLHAVHARKQMDLETYAKVGKATVEHIIELAALWSAGSIDAKVERKRWEACLIDAMRRKNEENKRARASEKVN